jgi:hypothetical protein
MSEALQIWTLVPRPYGHRHHSFRQILRCLVSNGDPGFDVTEVVP